MTLPTSIISKPAIDISHHRIHEGNHFIMHRIAKGINIITPKYFLIIPPPIQPNGSIIEMHIIFGVETEPGGGTLEFFENSTITNTGISLELNIINNNRRSATTSLCQIFEDPTVTNTGKRLFEEIGGTTNSGADLGEFNRNDEEFILHQSYNYILKFTPLKDGTYITMEINWYDNRPSSPVPIPIP